MAAQAPGKEPQFIPQPLAVGLSVCNADTSFFGVRTGCALMTLYATGKARGTGLHSKGKNWYNNE